MPDDQEVASLQATFTADDSEFQGVAQGILDALGGIGDSVMSLASPLSDLFTGSLDAAANHQVALVRLDALYKNLSATTTQSDTSVGHWAVTTEATGAKAEKWGQQLDLLNARLSDNEARLSKAKGTHAALQVTIQQEQQQIGKLTDELGLNTAGQKYWVSGSNAMLGAAKPTEQSLIDLSSALSKTTEYSRDSVLGVEALMLPYQNLGASIIPGLTQATLDVAAATGIDATSAAKTLAKAEDDPIKGATMLRRANIQLTASETDKIQALQLSGDLYGAQKSLLDDIEARYGGVANAIGGTFQGQLAIFNNTLNDAAATIGGVFLPALTAIVDFGTQLVTNFETLDPGIQQTAALFAAAGAAVMLLASPLGALVVPITLIAGAIVGVNAIWQSNWLGIASAVSNAWGTIQPDLVIIQQAFQGFMANLFPAQQAVIPDSVFDHVSGQIADGIKKQNAAAQTSNNVPFLTHLVDAIEAFAPQFARAFQDMLTKGVNAGVGWMETTGIPALTSEVGKLIAPLESGLGTALANISPVGIVAAVVIGGLVIELGLLQAIAIGGALVTGLSAIAASLGAILVVATPLILPLLVIGAIVAAYATNFLGVRDAINQMGTVLKNVIGDGLTMLGTFTDGIATQVGKWLTTLEDFGKSVIRDVLPPLEALLNLIMFADVAMGKTSQAGQIALTLATVQSYAGMTTPGKAIGGKYGNSPFIAGEWGRELVMPSDSGGGGSVMSARATREMLGGSGSNSGHTWNNAQISVNANDPAQFARELKKVSDRNTGR